MGEPLALAAPVELHTECEDNPHPCFACKSRIWRKHGMNLVVPQRFKQDQTQRELAQQNLADAKASGRPFDLAKYAS